MAFSTQTRKLYNGEVTLHFSPNARNRYQLESGEAPVGVTTVLSKVLAKEALMLWPMYQALGFLDQAYKDGVFKDITLTQGIDIADALWADLKEEAAKAHVKKSDKGKDVGSEVHELIEEWLNTRFEYKTMSLEAEKPFDAFVKWFLQSNAKVLATEQIVYSREYNVAGTFDALFKIDGKIVLADVKTSNSSRTAPLGIYPENFIQLGAYSLIYKEMGGSYIDDLLVINAGKDGKLNTLRASELGLQVRDCEDAFKSVLSTYRFLEPLKKQIKERVE